MNNLLKLELEDMPDVTEDNQETEKETFKIEDLGQANWAFRKLAALNQKTREIEQLARAEKVRIEDWEKREKESLKHNINFFNYLLEEFYREQRAMDPKFKLSTPYGQVSSRKQQPKWNYDDEKTIESLKKYKLKDFIRVKEEVNKADFKKEVEVLKDVVSLNGEICQDISRYGDILFINKETGEIYDTGEHEYHKLAVVYEGKVIEGVTIEEREPTITIKVVE